MERALKYVAYTTLFAVPFVPLLVTNPMFFPFITGKAFAFRVLVLILLAAWIGLALLNAKYRPRFSPLLFAFAAFVLVIGLADAFGENPFKSFWSNFERMEGFITLLHLFGYFVASASLLITEKVRRYFFQTSIGVSAIIAIYGIFQLLGFITINQGGVRLDGTFGNASYLAVYMLFHIFLTLFFLSREKAGMIRYAYMGAILLQIIALYFTATRGAILGLIGGLLLAGIGIALFGKETPKLRKIAIGGLIGLTILVGGFFAVKNTSYIQDSSGALSRLASISLSEGDARFYVWNMAWEGFKEKPFLGWGQENFSYVFNKYYDPALYSQEPWFDRVHNIILDWLIAGGALGLIAYLSIIGTLLFLFLRRSNNFTVVEKSLLFGLLVAYGFHNLFVFDNIGSYILFVSILAYVHARTRQESQSAFTLSPMLQKVGVGTTATVAVILLFVFNFSGIRAANGLIHAISPQQQGLDRNIELFEEVLAIDSFGNQEIREQILQGASQVANNQEIPVTSKRALLNLMDSEMALMLKEVPNDARLRLFYGSALRAYDARDRAKEQLEVALTLSPRKQAIMFELALVHIGNQEFPEAFELLKTAYEFEPENRQAQTLYIVGAIYNNELALARELSAEFYENGIADNDLVVQAYFENGFVSEVIRIWEYRVERQPGNAQYWVSLGASYLADERRQDAIAALEKAIELNPEFKEQGEAYISEIRAGRNP